MHSDKQKTDDLQNTEDRFDLPRSRIDFTPVNLRTQYGCASKNKKLTSPSFDTSFLIRDPAVCVRSDMISLWSQKQLKPLSAVLLSLN